MRLTALALVTASITVVSVASANALGLWMSGNQLQETLAGQKISGHYASGRKFTEDFHTDGTLIYKEIGKRNTGRWSVAGDNFCTIYSTDPTGGCYRVSRVGTNCFEFYFIARTKAQATQPDDNQKPAWTARAWLTNEESTCEDESFV